jgi:DUF4097 and DUF4098 domain-containing protein YvlB
VKSASKATTATSQHQVFSVSGKPKVVVKVTVPGSIDVKRGQDGEVVVDTKVTESDLVDFELGQNGNVVSVRSHTKSWNPVLWGSYFLSQGPRTSVSVLVPQQADLSLETSTDPISVSGISGTIDADSKTGSIQFAGCSGIIDATSHTGSLNLDNVNGALTLRATTGPIRFLGSLTDNSTFRSTTGSIDITLVGEQNLSIDASTTVGQITCALDLSDSRFEKGQYIGQHISGKIGTGAGRLSVETTVGSISIHK